ncbi:hypothetical protein [Gilliamella sp. B2838]|uniref:hypothetical protein n=1 Tax=Gilliamella sp. B2838 TaxID=2818020 RepID=UPI00226AA689|nr:hypothetical protein [Gilliamella sp. B2838]MCX8726836.1 hypothetical protein [Gilliamella sp. B2838]
MQAERDAGGSIIQHWKPSEQLLEVAKKAVEIAIDYINSYSELIQEDINLH